MSRILIGFAFCISGCGPAHEPPRKELTTTLLTVIAREVDTHRARAIPREYPETLQVLVEAKRIRDTQLVDAWGSAFVYKVDGPSYELCSNGPDGTPGNTDDICADSR